jgi:hypothetical protein
MMRPRTGWVWVAIGVVLCVGSLHLVARAPCPNGCIATAFLCEVATGQVHELSVRNRRLQISERAGLTNVEVQYQVEIPRSYFTTESQMDPSLSYRLTLTQYYSQLTAGGHTFVAVSRYRGVWQRLDSQVAASDGFLRAGVGGPTLGGGMLYNTEDGSHFVPSSYSIRTLTPSWAGI